MIPVSACGIYSILLPKILQIEGCCHFVNQGSQPIPECYVMSTCKLTEWTLNSMTPDSMERWQSTAYMIVPLSQAIFGDSGSNGQPHSLNGGVERTRSTQSSSIFDASARSEDSG